MEELERQYLISLYGKRAGFLGETPAAPGWTLLEDTAGGGLILHLRRDA